MVKHSIAPFAILFALLAACVASADADRDRKVRVALALATEGPPGYAEAYRRAVRRGEPLVLYVGCSGRHPLARLPNVVVGVTGELTGYDRGTVVVGYPHAGRLFVHAALRCEDHGDALPRAVEEARKKIAAPPAKAEAAPVPLNWEVRAGY